MLELKVIKAGEKGFGYLIENDGYISPFDDRNKHVIQEIKKLEKGLPIIAEPLIVTVVLQKYGVKNRNGRVYPESVLRAQEKVYQDAIKYRGAIGELDHPESSIIAGERISHNIIRTWWEGHTLMGEMEILMSPGFVNFGIISCKGDQVANLLRLGIRIGVSSRGVGSLEEDRQGNLIVQSDFELICWDVVTAPSTPGSWIFKKKEEAAPFIESEIKNKSILSDNLDRFLLD